MKKAIIPIANIGDYKKSLMIIHKTYHKEEHKKNQRKALAKGFIRWLFGN